MLTLASTATRPQAGGCLKMADERSRPPYSQPSPIGSGRFASRSLREHEPSPQQPLRGLVVPTPYAWPALRALDGDALFDHYRHTLEKPGKHEGRVRALRALRAAVSAIGNRSGQRLT